MFETPRALVALIMSAWFVVFAMPSIAAPTPTERQARIDKEFHAVLVKVDAAQRELQNGKPEAFKALWSHADDVTLSGGFGGTIEKGWDQVGRRLDWVGAQFSNGTNTIERIVAKANDAIGYVIQIEHVRFQVPGQTTQSTRDYRVTMLFRREPEGWRIVHRQADSQMTKAVPQ
ncbi:MAG: nuclear transport factor 2 family protein [Steroidobacteraceae bacterium]|nr:nuclear transport factor 2 family protein [Steroidobacteraceae bacterium]